MDCYTLYDKCKLDVYVKYLEYLEMTSKFKEDKEIINAIFDKYENYYEELRLTGQSNQKIVNDITSYFENRIGVCNQYFDEITEIHFLNDFARLNYYKFKVIEETFKEKNDFSLFIKNGIKMINKKITEFTMYVDDIVLDYYAEKLRMSYNVDASNKLNILSKISGIMNIIQMLYKYQVIDDYNYCEILEIYQLFLNDNCLEVNVCDVRFFVEKVNQLVDSLCKTYNISTKKKIKY